MVMNMMHGPPQTDRCIMVVMVTVYQWGRHWLRSRNAELNLAEFLLGPRKTEMLSCWAQRIQLWRARGSSMKLRRCKLQHHVTLWLLKNAEVMLKFLDSLLNHVRFHCLRVKEVREEDLTIFDLHFHDIAVRPPFRFKNWVVHKSRNHSFHHAVTRTCGDFEAHQRERSQFWGPTFWKSPTQIWVWFHVISLRIWVVITPRSESLFRGRCLMVNWPGLGYQKWPFLCEYQLSIEKDAIERGRERERETTEWLSGFFVQPQH